MHPSLRLVRDCAAALLTVGVLVPVPALAGGDAAPWPVAGGDPEHSSAAEGPAPAYRVAWETEPDGGPPIADPVVGGDAVYVVGRTALVALDPATGDELWSADRAAGTGGPPASAGNRVLFVQGAGDETELAAVSAEDGTPQWETPLDDTAPGGVTVAEGVAYVGTRGGTLHAVEVRDGTQVWSASVGEGEDIEGVPAVAGGRVFVTALKSGQQPTGALYAFDVESGEREWALRPEGSVVGPFSSPSVAGDLVVAGMGDGMVRGVDADEGAVRWTARTRSAFGPGHIPAVAGDGILVSDVLGHIHHLALEDGTERWVYRVPGFMVEGSVSISGDTVLAADDSGQYTAIDLDDALLVWRRTVGEQRANAVAVTGDLLYAASTSGPVLALEHDPDAALLAEPSPTVLFPGRALLNFAGAFALLLAALLGLFRLPIGRRG